MSNRSYILGVDTSHTQGQLCLYENSDLKENIVWEKSGSHSESLTKQYEFLLERYPELKHQLSKIYCIQGPGSFTGLRVGINFAKTLAFTNDIPILPVNSLFALALLCEKRDGKIVSTIDAQRNAVFLSLFSWKKNQLITEVENQIISINHLDSLIKEEIYSCGSGILRYQNFLNSNLSQRFILQKKTLFPDLTKLIPMNEKENFLSPTEWMNVHPLYIRLSSAEEKLTRPKS